MLISKPQPDLEKYRIAKCFVARFGTATDDVLPYSKVFEHYETIQLK